MEAMHVHDVRSSKVRPQQVGIGGRSVCCRVVCCFTVVFQLLDEHPVRLVEVFSGVFDGVGNVPKILPHGFVLAMDPESLSVEFCHQYRHGLFVQSPFFRAGRWNQIVGGAVVAATAPVFVAEVVDNGGGFVDTEAVFLDKDRYLPEWVVMFDFFGLGHDGDVSIGNPEFFERPETSKGTRHAHSNKLGTGTTHHNTISVTFE